MNAKRDEVMATLVAAGMDADNVNSWSDDEMASKVKRLPAIKDELKEPKAFPHRKLLKKLLKAGEAGEEITIAGTTSNGHAETNGHAPKAKGKKTGKVKTKAKKERQVRGPINRGDLTRRDTVGSPVGSSEAMANKV